MKKPSKNDPAIVVVLNQKWSFKHIQRLSIQDTKHDAREGQFKMLQHFTRLKLTLSLGNKFAQNWFYWFSNLKSAKMSYLISILWQLLSPLVHVSNKNIMIKWRFCPWETLFTVAATINLYGGNDFFKIDREISPIKKNLFVFSFD